MLFFSFINYGFILFIESYLNASVKAEIKSSLFFTKLIPKDELNQWFVYDDEIIIQQFMQSLNDRGIREHNLLVNLKKTMPFIHTEFEQNKK